jgi:hypothetical protein
MKHSESIVHPIHSPLYTAMKNATKQKSTLNLIQSQVTKSRETYRTIYMKTIKVAEALWNTWTLVIHVPGLTHTKEALSET